MKHTFVITLEPLNEAQRTRWCDVGGCQAQVLFQDEDRWVCWPHGQLKLRETRQWWAHETLTAEVIEVPLGPLPPLSDEDLTLLLRIIDAGGDVEPLKNAGHTYSAIAMGIDRVIAQGWVKKTEDVALILTAAGRETLTNDERS